MKKYLFILIFALVGSLSLSAQTSQTLYFMDEIAERNNMNPALTPNCKFYFDFIVLPNFYLNAGTDQFVINDLIFNRGGQTTSFLSSPEETSRFLGKLKPATTLNVNFNINILSFGFRFARHHFLTFDMGVNADVAAYIPRDVFRFALLGTPDPDGINSFNLNKLGVDASLYSHVAVGYMNKINEHWTFGLKAKYLMGYANVQTDIDAIRLNASRNEWSLTTDGRINASLPLNYSNDENGYIDPKSIELQEIRDIVSLTYRPAGHGAALDLGFAYRPIPNLTISAAVTDLGGIYWQQNLVGGAIYGQHTLDGFVDFTPGNEISGDIIMERLTGLGNDIVGSISTDSVGNGYLSMLNANFTAGVEYGVLKNRISFGVVNRLRFNHAHVRDEVTLAVNFRPANWFKASLSYSFINGRGANLGVGLNLRMGAVNTYLIMDYVPLSWSNVSGIPTNNNNGSDMTIPLPNRTQMFSIQAGMALNLHRFCNDPDDDGVYRRRDHCPNTDLEYLRSRCPGLKRKQLIDRNGCDLDADADGVHDCYDLCPETPAGVEVDSVGCPVDSDHDGVPDYLDKCLGTPEGVAVDENGCPLDADGDRVPDYLDRCHATPFGVEVDSVGCPVDSDHDGVPNYLDRCPDSPEGVEVDEYGCPVDSDGDGVADFLDQCPDTPKGVQVEAVGCPVDSDGDGIPDYLDKCPDKKGLASNDGCPELPKEVTQVFKKAMTGIQFVSGKSTIKSSSFPVLDMIVSVMELNPDYNLNISGHTDNVGKADLNLRLSADRAAAVCDYLIMKGISASRLHSEGFGDTMPIADNKTAAGRTQNRRVEFEVVYEVTTLEQPTEIE